MDRRKVLRTGAAALATLAVGPRAFAQVNPTAGRDAELLRIARAQVERAGAKLWRRDMVAIADFGLHSAYERFHFVDLANNRVRSFHVTHGDGSDPQHDGWLKWYSNVEGSHCTSRGAYMTRSWYVGRFGTSIRLDGLDATNSNALDRAIVMHPADYARPEHIGRFGKLGRSNGCFAMGPAEFAEALIHLAGGRLLYAESLGLTPSGARVPPPIAQTDLLTRFPPQGTFERTNPGVF
ncbi:murein L,D-transpeptidase catalytic domain-containing protein [Qipengyuania sediminis]|uniref:murein L,D-transpeptidase catalytic domain-containing protein n=1 Tax=Qipengyuania sediminis TaxID=1532023 RepID=UPI00105A034E|nr:murein L,D-transpeptidase catalytic domain family protein [Qipengyuania sediminis]